MDQSSNAVLPVQPRRTAAPRGALRWARASLGSILSGAALLTACSAELVPLAPDEDGVSRAHTSGVEVQAVVSRSREYIPKSLTPVKLSVRNLSPDGVYVSLEDIRLVGKGATLAAVDPIDIEPRRPVPSIGVDPASPYAPDAPVSSTSGVPVLKHGFEYDSAASGSDPGWRSYRDYAKHEIKKDAFTGGFIDRGEAQEGYVYFAAPPAGVDQLNLQVRLHSGEGSGPGVVVDIPYATKG